MGLFDLIKKRVNRVEEKNDDAVTSSPFIYDGKYKIMVAEINGIRFQCNELNSEIEKMAYQLENAYKIKLSLIISEMMDEVTAFFGEMTEEQLMNSLGMPTINLDNNVMTYTEHTLDNIHVIDVEFNGNFDGIFEVRIDG